MDDKLVSPPGLAVGNAQKRSGPIGLYLFLLVVAAMVPSFLFSAVLLKRNNEAQERTVETLITGTARAIVQAVDREINAYSTTLRVLATNSALIRGDLGEFHRQVTNALAPSGSFAFVLDIDLMSILSTRRPFRDQTILKTNDVTTAERVFSRMGSIVVSDLVYGAISKDYVVNVLLGVPNTGLGPLALAFNRSARQFTPVLLVNRLPSGWNVALVDGKGKVIVASPGGGETGSDFAVSDLKPYLSSSVWGEVKVGSVKSYLVAQRSLLADWTVAVWAPSDVVSRPLANSMWSLIAGGLLLASAVMLIVYWLTLRITRSVRGLEADAKRLGAGQPVEARPFPVAEIETVSAALGDASRRRQAAESEVRFLMRELAHRSKNQMTVIAAMAKQTARGVESVPDFVTAFERRIFGLARSTDLLLAHGVAGIDLRELVISQIDPFCPVDGDRVLVEGPSLRLNAQAAQILGMAAHELATNAVKHGAFVNEGGQLAVTWQRVDNRAEFIWRETGVGDLPPQARRGFGTAVLENMVGRSLGAEVSRSSEGGTLIWRFLIPLTALDPAYAHDLDTVEGEGDGLGDGDK
jgi:two-component sensor histidine kinase